MPKADEIYVHCDQLEKLPALNRENWLWESAWLIKNLEPNASVLQVGSCEGSRIVNIMKERPDLRITGIEIDPILHEMALEHFETTGTDAQSVLGDITNLEDTKGLGHFEYCLCLNNTLGYIPDEEAVLTQMKRLADTAIISVYGENFTDDIARTYFAALKLEVTRIEGNALHMSDFGIVRRYTKEAVAKWGGEIIKTPLGYLSMMQ